MSTILTVIGTRPEAIKMAPVVHEIAKKSQLSSVVCCTGQHEQLIADVTDALDLSIDINLNLMGKTDQLPLLLGRIISEMTDVINKVDPDLVLIHGDTTTCLGAALSAFYCGRNIGHVEAGLRTYNLKSPWPEEANRRMVGQIASYHYAPTSQARSNLMKEGVADERIVVTGNTVIDALLYAKNKNEQDGYIPLSTKKLCDKIEEYKNMILVTGHRRENLGAGFEGICRALLSISHKHPHNVIVFPVHLNPMVGDYVKNVLGGRGNILLVDPLDYSSFIHVMSKATIVLTDSGGIQEEAPSLGIPVLVLRENTERPEAIIAGTVKLVGTNTDDITMAVDKLLQEGEAYVTMRQAVNPYGDGKAAHKIVSHVVNSVL